MNKEFVPYEQALALKDLGFNEPCLAQYRKYEVGEPDLDIGFSKNEIVMQFHKLSKFCSAPLYQQAFKWFRDKYNLDSFVKHLYKSTIKVGYYFGIDEYKGVKFQMDFDIWYNTYEEAELECLKKLIEIVKKK